MRIGINVPNEVINTIKELDPEANISQICREALSSHAAAAKRAQTEITDEDMDEIVERLEWPGSHPYIEPDWATYAWQDAQDWVKAIAPRDWYYFLCGYDHYKESSRELYMYAQFRGIGNHKGVKSYIDRFMENDDWFWREAVIGGNLARQKAHEKAENDYMRTWLAYVNEVRRKWLRNRAKEGEKALAGRQRAWLSRPEPEVPPQLQN